MSGQLVLKSKGLYHPQSAGICVYAPGILIHQSSQCLLSILWSCKEFRRVHFNSFDSPRPFNLIENFMVRKDVWEHLALIL